MRPRWIKSLLKIIHCIFYACSVVKMMIMLCFKHFFCINTVKFLPREQKLHFRCVSWRAKSILCRHPFKSVQKFGRINFKKTGFFLFLTGLEHCVSLAWILRSRWELTQFFYSRETRAIWRQTWRLILLANRVTNFAHAR